MISSHTQSDHPDEEWSSIIRYKIIISSNKIQDDSYLRPSVGLSSSAKTAITICPANMVTVASCLVSRQSAMSLPVHQWKHPVPSNLIYIQHKPVIIMEQIITWIPEQLRTRHPQEYHPPRVSSVWALLHSPLSYPGQDHDHVCNTEQYWLILHLACLLPTHFSGPYSPSHSGNIQILLLPVFCRNISWYLPHLSHSHGTPCTYTESKGSWTNFIFLYAWYISAFVRRKFKFLCLPQWFRGILKGVDTRILKFWCLEAEIYGMQILKRKIYFSTPFSLNNTGTCSRTKLS